MKRTDVIYVRVDAELHGALRTAADTHGVSDAEMARRLIRRGLALDAGNEAASELSDVVRGVIREELRSTRRLAYIAAFESAAAHRLTRNSHADSMARARAGREAIAKTVDLIDADARRWAAARSKEPEPADPLDDAPAEPLPHADEEIDLSGESAGSRV